MAHHKTSVPQVPRRRTATDSNHRTVGRHVRPQNRGYVPPPEDPIDAAELLDFTLQYCGVIALVVATTVCSAVFVILPIARLIFEH